MYNYDYNGSVWQKKFHIKTVYCSEKKNEKGKPAERQGRKATGLRRMLRQPGCHDTRKVHGIAMDFFLLYYGKYSFQQHKRKGERVWRNLVLMFQEMY
ncbi:hypothetical protein SAMN02745136_02811 [Anaerocolumna jejuensis DSM 15929]|uniref:Uncharacterized protein n=1 Tax=Anaerocolumna jejuensis DSM 15929 TaxID=1121322 RepID=A0A1M6THZ1_9FIRM|nr:hypothetical protein SAMN02745136_02811 [Anaerocolumna jejuensis DSM 15929]